MTYKLRTYVCPADHVTRMLKWDTDEPPRCETCGSATHEDVPWTNKAACVIGDECDEVIRHGICNPDGSPKRYTSKADMRAAAKALGLENQVRHIPQRGSDRSPHTSRWV